MIARVRVCSLAALLAACSLGTRPEDFIPAVTPHGVSGSLRVQGGEALSIELLEVSDSTLTVLTRDSVAIVRHADVALMNLVQIGTAASLSPGGFLEQARAASRFPAGIPPHVMTTLLAASGQMAPIRLRPRADR